MMSMNKQKRKEMLVRARLLLAGGISTNNQELILQGYKIVNELMNDHGVFSLADEPEFPKEPT